MLFTRKVTGVFLRERLIEGGLGRGLRCPRVLLSSRVAKPQFNKSSFAMSNAHRPEEDFFGVFDRERIRGRRIKIIWRTLQRLLGEC